MAKVLIVDDSIMIRKLIRTILEKENHTVIAEAGNGEEAYFKYRVFKPDLVTMDVSMPEVNGIEGVRRIVSDFPDAMIVMVSAISQKEMILDALESGARHYIIKPITVEKMKNVLEDVLNPVRIN